MPIVLRALTPGQHCRRWPTGGIAVARFFNITAEMLGNIKRVSRRYGSGLKFYFTFNRQRSVDFRIIGRGLLRELYDITTKNTWK